MSSAELFVYNIAQASIRNRGYFPLKHVLAVIGYSDLGEITLQFDREYCDYDNAITLKRGRCFVNLFNPSRVIIELKT